MLAVVAWLGVVTGHWLTQYELNIWSGNPLSWLYYQSQALKVGWGYFFLLLQILSFYVWAFTDSFRITALSTSFVSNVLHARVGGLLVSLEDGSMSWSPVKPLADSRGVAISELPVPW